MTDASRTILLNTLKEWNKFVADRDKLTAAAKDIAELARRCTFESVAFLKTQGIDVDAGSPATMKIMSFPIHIEPVIETSFPNVKATVSMKCSGASRVIIINPNFSI